MRYIRTLIGMIIVIFIVCMVVVGLANAESSGVCGSATDWKLDSAGTLTIFGNGEMFDYSHEGAPWYNERTRIKRVVIEEGVTVLGDYSIENCNNLISITIPESLYGLGFYSISGCPNLSELTIPGEIRQWGTPMIYDCNQLHVYLNMNAVPLLRTLREYDFPYTIMDANSDFIFVDEHSVSAYIGTEKTVIIPNGVTRIYSQAFAYDRNIETVILPDTITSIEHEAFMGCISLKSITLPESLIQIEVRAFSDCTQLESITLPSTLNSISAQLFMGCTGLKEIHLPTTFANIEYGAFSACENLQTVYFGGTEERKETININNEDEANRYIISAEWICEGNESDLMLCGNNVSWTISDGGVLNLSGSGEVFDFSRGGAPWYNRRHEISKIYIEEGITVLGNYSFEDMDNLVSISIPESLYGLGFYAISGCTKLKELTIPSEIRQWGTPMIYNCAQLHVNLTQRANAILRTLREYNIPFTVFDAESDFIYVDDYSVSAYIGSEDIVIIPNGVTRIYSHAFAYDRNIKTIILPNSVTSIEHEAFMGCSSLQNIVFSTSLIQIEVRAFSDCASLETISLPKSIRSIDTQVFMNCTGLKRVYLASNFANVAYGAFQDCSSITDVFFEGTEQQKQTITINEENDYFINANWHLNYNLEKSKLFLPEGLKRIESQAFVNTHANYIVISDEIEYIADDAFSVGTILVVSEGGYAERWAQEHGFQTEYSE